MNAKPNNGFQVRVWDPALKCWVLHCIRDSEDDALEAGRVLWRRGERGVRISVWEERVVIEHKK